MRIATTLNVQFNSNYTWYIHKKKKEEEKYLGTQKLFKIETYSMRAESNFSD